jgi:hypothetical protein
MSDDQYDETLGKLFDREFMKHVKPIGGTTDQKIRGRGTTRTDVRIDDSPTLATGHIQS